MLNIKKMMRKKGISPVIASIILIAITVAVAIAVAGWVFGIFGGASTYAKVTIVSATYDLSEKKINVTLTNTGTAATSVAGGRVTVGETTKVFASSDISGDTSLPAGGSTTITFDNAPHDGVTAGQTYVLTVILADGTQLIYEGEVVP